MGLEDDSFDALQNAAPRLSQYAWHRWNKYPETAQKAEQSQDT